MHPILFWSLYAVLGIWVEYFIPGIDFFAPAVLVCLEMGKVRQLCWLLPLWILLQEGTGTTAFGNSILWYILLIASFKAGQYIFESKNFGFIMLFGVFMAVVYFVLTYVMSVGMQGLVIDPGKLISHSINIAVTFFPIWIFTQYVFKKCFPQKDYFRA